MEPCDHCSCESLIEVRVNAMTELEKIECPKIGSCRRLIYALESTGILAVTKWHDQLRMWGIPFERE